MHKRLAAWTFVAAMAAALLAALPGAAQRGGQEVDLELVLLADASGSIDSAELKFQREGYATALAHPDVLRAILSGARQRIAVTYVEWGNEAWQDVVVPWSILTDASSARRFGEALLAAPRRAYGSNAIGSAIAKGQALIEGNDIRGDRLVIDLSADSARSWSGVPLPLARAEALARGIIINGLAIACRDQGCGGRPLAAEDLEAAFEREIIGGPGSFVVTADGQTSFAEAVRKKLVLEISSAPAPAPRFAARDARP